jgi:hypothetical protein
MRTMQPFPEFQINTGNPLYMIAAPKKGVSIPRFLVRLVVVATQASYTLITSCVSPNASQGRILSMKLISDTRS